jgi:hypothetical protein
MTADQLTQLKSLSWLDFYQKYMPMRLKGQITEKQMQKLVEIKQTIKPSL